MGNSASSAPIPYALPVVEEEPTHEGRSHVYRAATHYNGIIDGFVFDSLETAVDVFETGRKASCGGHCLGQRRVIRDESTGDVTYGAYEWYTYDQVKTMGTHVGSGLMNFNLCEEIQFPEEQYEPARSLRMLGICSKNRLEWFLVELACNIQSVALVPLYDTLGEEAILYIVETTKLQTVCMSTDVADTFLKVLETNTNSKRTSSLKTLVLFDPFNGDLTTRASKLGIRLLSFDDVRSSGKNKPQPQHLPNKTSISTICFTSGTTGLPKGVLITHGAFAANVSAAIRGPLATAQFTLSKDDIHMSYLPLAHVFERIICHLVWVMGGSAAIYSGDTAKLLEDIKVAKPTVFISVPRLFMRINDKVNAGLKEKSALAQYLFNTGLNSKINRLRRKAIATDPIWDAVVFNKTRALLGGRVRYMLTGSAPLESIVQERMAALFCAVMLEGYGLTETLGASFIKIPSDPIAGHVGGVLPCNEFVLESVPDMKYFVTDPMPRGELLIRGHTVTKGYFMNPAQTKEAFTEDGYFRTGDIVVVLPGGAVKIIDRRKNIFKLAQGEYVAPERIENVLVQCEMVGQIFVHGDSDKPFLVAIVVPAEHGLEVWKKSHNMNGKTDKEICQMPEFYDDVMKSIREQEVVGGVKGFEKIKMIYLETEDFSLNNGLLTPTFKIKRHEAKLRYKNEIEDMYAKLATQSDGKAM